MSTVSVELDTLDIAIGAFKGVIEGRETGAMEKDQARDIVAAGNGLVRAAGQRITARVSAAKIGMIEAKMIEGEARRQTQMIEEAPGQKQDRPGN
jgi:hypothetical protein